jgi:hypothetical protein
MDSRITTRYLLSYERDIQNIGGKLMSDLSLAEQYKNVIADLKQAIGFKEKSMTKALSVLNTRLYELEEIWSIPDEEWIDPVDNPTTLSKLVNDSFSDSRKNNTSIVDEIETRLAKFRQDDTND